MKNAQGLERNIPEEVKRIVRQKCGFGCIFCGNWICQYEHIIPTFSEAKEHNPDNICLLCSNHHQKVTTGRISKAQVLEQYKNPYALQVKCATDILELKTPFYVAFGRIFFTKISNLITVDNVSLLSFDFTEKGAPLALSAKFFDDKGNLIFEIQKNEMIGYVSNWDIEQKGPRITIRRKSHDIVLQIKIDPPDIIEIERINMVYGAARIYSDVNTGVIIVKSTSGATIDLQPGQIITEGLTITSTQIVLDKAAIFTDKDGLGAEKLDYRALIDSGKIFGLKRR